MKALIIGGAGFVGKHLIRHLKEDLLWQIAATKMEQEEILDQEIELFDLDILNVEQVKEVIQKADADYIFHLAALSSVALSWKNPGLTVDINIKGSLNVLDAVKKMAKRPRVILIGSGEEYGRIKPEETPVKEDTVLRPGNLYAATKAAQNMIGKIYADAYQMDLILIRAFNHIGPGQAPMFVVSDFCKQAAEIENKKKEPVIKVGNLSAKRDFTDVRDVVRAYGLLAQKGKSGETYNVGSGHAISIQEILDRILRCTQCSVSVVVEQERLRPIDIPIIEADISKLVEDTGWKPQIALDQTISDTFLYWKNNS